MSRTQLPSIFPWTAPSKTPREIVKNELPKTCKRKKDDKIQSSSDTVSSLIESPTQSTSYTKDEIQRSHTELEKKLKESKLKRKKFSDFKLNRKKMKDFRCKENSTL